MPRKEIEIAIEIVVGKRRRLRGVGRIGQPRQVRGVHKTTLPIVDQQGIANLAGAPEPAPTDEEDVAVAVAIDVGMNQVAATELTGEASRCRLIFEDPSRVQTEEPHRRARLDRRRDDVQQAVAIEILHQPTAGGIVDHQPRPVCHVPELADVVGRAHRRGRDAMFRGHPVRVATQGHRRDVEQPLRNPVARHSGQESEEGPHRFGRPARVGVAARFTDRQQAHPRAMVGNAVAHLAQAQMRQNRDPAATSTGLRPVADARRPGAGRGTTPQSPRRCPPGAAAHAPDHAAPALLERPGGRRSAVDVARWRRLKPKYGLWLSRKAAQTCSNSCRVCAGLGMPGVPAKPGAVHPNPVASKTARHPSFRIQFKAVICMGSLAHRRLAEDLRLPPGSQARRDVWSSGRDRWFETTHRAAGHRE